MTASFKTVLARGDGSDVAVEVTYDYTRASRGARDSCGGVAGAGPPLEPDEPESVEILGAKYMDGVDLELTNDEEERLKREALEQVHENYLAEMEAKAEAKRDDERLFGRN